MDGVPGCGGRMRSSWSRAIVPRCARYTPVRPESGASVHAFGIDYDDDLESLCDAEVPDVRNARMLSSDTSYNSPC